MIPRPKASASAVPGLRPTHVRQWKLRATPRSSAVIDKENLSRASSSSATARATAASLSRSWSAGTHRLQRTVDRGGGVAHERQVRGARAQRSEDQTRAGADDVGAADDDQ